MLTMRSLYREACRKAAMKRERRKDDEQTHLEDSNIAAKCGAWHMRHNRATQQTDRTMHSGRHGTLIDGMSTK